MREQWSRDPVLFPTFERTVTLPGLHQIRMFCANWANLRCTGKPVAVLSAHHFLWESAQRAQPFYSSDQKASKPEEEPHRSSWRLVEGVRGQPLTVIRKILSTSQVFSSPPCVGCVCVFACVCVSVRKLNLLLAPCAPITHYSCKLILCSCNCKFPFSMTMKAILGAGKGLLPACSQPPSTVPFQ